ncbi:hypothetical protein [Gemmobacter sp.]|uniref:hypothetical protein n=1 Tax=Gemmobacter sp. TaxID=1898957 RepID=UPI002AFF1037|nr:hypothetical protein [Gemmobacter sp.]
MTRQGGRRPQFRIYSPGYQDGESQPLELESVSLCFRDPAALRAFGEFVMECADGMVVSDWDHEHHFGDGADPMNIIISVLHED